MKIFVFTTVFAPRIGGIERLTEVLAREWTGMGHDVVVATSTPGPEDGFAFRVVRSATLATFLRWGRWCDVHVQMNISLKYTFVGRATSPAAVVVHNGQYGNPKSWKDPRPRLKMLLAGRYEAIAVSAFVARSVGKGWIIPNPFDDGVFRSRTAWCRRSRDIAFVGRLVSDKGCDTLLDALLQLRMLGVRPFVTIIGDGEDRPKLEEFALDHGLAKSVRFTGALAPSAVAEELNRHRFVVVPSRCDEGFGIVALEGLACGCVPIVAGRGGLPEAIGTHGYLVENGDADELARILACVLRHPETAQRKLEDVDAHLAQFTSRRVAEKYLDVFAQLVNANP